MRFHRNLYEQIRYDTDHGVAVQEPPEDRPLWPLLLWCAVPGALLLLFAALRGRRAVMDAVVYGFTTPLKHALARLNDAVPFAVGELVWALALLGLAAYLLRGVYLLVRGGDRLRLLARRLLGLAGAALTVACCYTLMWGCNYYAASFTQRAGLSQRASTPAELAQMSAAFAGKCNELAAQQPRDGSGQVDYSGADLFRGSAALYQGIEKELPALAVERHDPKPMRCSRLLSLTGFSGFYFPMTAESIVNVDQAACMIPATILHELAHQCNVAEEDAANFVAILAGLRCEDVRFQYSSALMGYIHLSNALAGADRSLYEQVRGTLSEQVRQDLEANDRYWARYESPVSDASEKVYTGFLESYGHSEGMKSYGMCVNLLSGYYLGEHGRWTEALARQAQDEAAAQSAQSEQKDDEPAKTEKTAAKTDKSSEKSTEKSGKTEKTSKESAEKTSKTEKTSDKSADKSSKTEKTSDKSADKSSKTEKTSDKSSKTDKTSKESSEKTSKSSKSKKSSKKSSKSKKSKKKSSKKKK